MLVSQLFAVTLVTSAPGASVGSIEQLRSLAAAEAQKRSAELGSEKRLLIERSFRRSDGYAYHRVADFSRAGPQRLDLTVSPTGAVTSVRVAPYKPKPTNRGTYKIRTPLRLPFASPPEGTVWAVTWGGDNYLDNYHDKNDTYFAYDMSPRSMSWKRPASKPEAPCWDVPILAAADGTVSSAINDIPDVMRIDHPDDEKLRGPGNTVVIDHGNGEFTAYSHMRQGSVPVRPGQRVTAGTVIGRCGSSGSGPMPHLHFQLMDGPDLDTANSLPITFVDYYAPYRWVDRGTPTRGDLLMPGLQP